MGMNQLPPAGRFARAIAAELRGVMASKTPRVSGLSLSKVPSIGRSQNYLAKRLRGERPFTLDELDSICSYLGIDSARLIHKVNEQIARDPEGRGNGNL